MTVRYLALNYQLILTFQMGHPRPLFRLFSVFSKQTAIHFLQ